MRGSSIAERNELERRVRDLENDLARTRFVASGGGPGTNLVYLVTMTGSLTGSTFNMAYSDLIQASIELVLRGRTLLPGVNFSISGATLTMLDPTTPFEVSDPASVKSFDNFFIRQAERT
jgi:hypothetical protein